MAHFFTAHERRPEGITAQEADILKHDLESLKAYAAKHQSKETDEIGYFEPLERVITRLELEVICAEISYNMDIARDIITLSDQRRYNVKIHSLPTD